MTTLINEIMGILNNRETAIMLWLLIVVIISTCSSKIRNLIFNIVKIFFGKKFVKIYVVMIVYVCVIVLLLKLANLWHIRNLGDTIKWGVLVAFLMLFSHEQAKQPNYFKTALVSNLKILVIIEFIVNLYVFSLLIEFFLVPFLAILGVKTAKAESDKQYGPEKKLTTFITSIIGCIFLVYLLFKVSTDFHNFATISTLESFYIPIILSIAFIPFVYLFALFCNYETFFIRLGFFVEDPVILMYAKRKTIWKINFSIKKLDKWSKYINSNWRFKEKQEVDDAILVFCNHQRENNLT